MVSPNLRAMKGKNNRFLRKNRNSNEKKLDETKTLSTSTILSEDDSSSVYSNEDENNRNSIEPDEDVELILDDEEEANHQQRQASEEQSENFKKKPIKEKLSLEKEISFESSEIEVSSPKKLDSTLTRTINAKPLEKHKCTAVFSGKLWKHLEDLRHNKVNKTKNTMNDINYSKSSSSDNGKLNLKFPLNLKTPDLQREIDHLKKMHNFNNQNRTSKSKVSESENMNSSTRFLNVHPVANGDPRINLPVNFHKPKSQNSSYRNSNYIDNWCQSPNPDHPYYNNRYQYINIIDYHKNYDNLCCQKGTSQHKFDHAINSRIISSSPLSGTIQQSRKYLPNTQPCLNTAYQPINKTIQQNLLHNDKHYRENHLRYERNCRKSNFSRLKSLKVEILPIFIPICCYKNGSEIEDICNEISYAIKFNLSGSGHNVKIHRPINFTRPEQNTSIEYEESEFYDQKSHINGIDGKKNV